MALCVRVCVCVRVHVRVRACACVCVRVRVRVREGLGGDKYERIRKRSEISVDQRKVRLRRHLHMLVDSSAALLEAI